MTSDTPYATAFAVCPGIGPVRYADILTAFGSAEAAWKARTADIAATGIPPKAVTAFDVFRSSFDPASYLKRLADGHIAVVSRDDPRYPRLLSEIPDPPIVLFVKGKRGDGPIPLSRSVAVVGSRVPTPYGREMTRRIAEGLAAAGVTVISGMAYGVDAVAHAAALDAGGSTVAVLGCGADVIAPAGNAALYRRITESGQGAIVSEMPLGSVPAKGLFVTRNRIVSGLSLGVVVTEGTRQSGSLITARYAAEQGRDVFAVPGPVTSPLSAGPIALLGMGATPVASSDDVLTALGLVADVPVKKHGLEHSDGVETDRDGRKVLSLLTGRGPMHIDELVATSGLTYRDVAATLTILEMGGKVRNTGKKTYVAA